MIKVGFIGAGNMGSALISAISGVLNTKVYIFDMNTEKAQSVAESYGAVVSDSCEIAGECDFIFLAVKPNIIPTVASEIRDKLRGGSVIVSMAAGVSLASLNEMLGADKKIIRIMPNTPVAVGEGVVLYCQNTAAQLAPEAEEAFRLIMERAGLIDKIDEGLIDAASALSGCGPAFVYMFAEALTCGAVSCGLPRDRALTYAADTLIGAARMILSTGKHPELLRDEVCSPGGSTIEGVHTLEAGGFSDITEAAVRASFEKTKRLGRSS